MALTDNPMTLVITGNNTISANIEVSTPTGSISIPTGVGSVTIPQGIKVVFVQAYWDTSDYLIDQAYVGVTAGKTYNLRGLYTEYNNGDGEMYEVYNSSNWKHWIYVENGTIDVDTGSAPIKIVISWSPTINQQTPNVTDY